MPLSSTRKVVKQGKHLKVGTIGPQLKLDPHKENPFAIVISQQKINFPTNFHQIITKKGETKQAKTHKGRAHCGLFSDHGEANYCRNKGHRSRPKIQQPKQITNQYTKKEKD